MKWPEFSGWDCRAHLLRLGPVKATLVQGKIGKLDVMNQKVEVYDIQTPRALPPRAPQWTDSVFGHEGHGEDGTVSRQPGQKARIKQHNARKSPNTHGIQLDTTTGVKVWSVGA